MEAIFKIKNRRKANQDISNKQKKILKNSIKRN